MRGTALVGALLTLAAPVRAEPLLRHTRLLDVRLAAAEAGAPPPEEPAPARRSAAWAIVPFGVGQFANDEPVKGALFCVGQVLSFLTAGATLGMIEANKTRSNGFMQGGDFKDPALASTLQTVELVAFWTGIALIGLGIADAFIFRPSPETTVAVAPTAVAVRF